MRSLASAFGLGVVPPQKMCLGLVMVPEVAAEAESGADATATIPNTAPMAMRSARRRDDKGLRKSNPPNRNGAGAAESGRPFRNQYDRVLITLMSRNLTIPRGA